MSAHRSSPETIPSGLNVLAPHIALISSFDLPLTSISFASLCGRLAILTLPQLRTEAHALAADCPASSISNMRTTVSKRSRNSKDF